MQDEDAPARKNQPQQEGPGVVVGQPPGNHLRKRERERGKREGREKGERGKEKREREERDRERQRRERPRIKNLYIDKRTLHAPVFFPHFTIEIPLMPQSTAKADAPVDLRKNKKNHDDASVLRWQWQVKPGKHSPSALLTG